MIVREYPTFEEALLSVITEEKQYILVRHTLGAGEKIKPHYHPNAREWIIVHNTICTVTMERVKKTFSPEGKYLVISFLPKKVHSFQVHVPVSYFVVRDRKDKTIFL
jgi:quercetin dioxygenase-like cupin family protein